MHQEDHLNKGRCSLEGSLGVTGKDRTHDHLHGIAAFSLTVSTAVGFGLITCFSVAC